MGRPKGSKNHVDVMETEEVENTVEIEETVQETIIEEPTEAAPVAMKRDYKPRVIENERIHPDLTAASADTVTDEKHFHGKEINAVYRDHNGKFYHAVVTHKYLTLHAQPEERRESGWAPIRDPLYAGHVNFGKKHNNGTVAAYWVYMRGMKTMEYAGVSPTSKAAWLEPLDAAVGWKGLPEYDARDERELARHIRSEQEIADQLAEAIDAQ